MKISEEIKSKNAKIGVIGLGYVGLPLAMEFAHKASVVGFDINEDNLAMMRAGKDPCRELDDEVFVNADILFTSSLEDLREANFYIVAVPTPIDEHNMPDLKPLLSATESVGRCLKPGDYVVYESTVYPGCTEEDCVPLLEKLSGLKAGVDFKFGYSPERINPGEKVHTLPNTKKIVSGCDAEALEQVAAVYEMVVNPGVFRAQSVKVAEAAKIIENTQRDVNIALMNELSIIFGRMGINTYDVLAAAGTKWNFLPFYPGLVGGHCIGVDPYYLVYKAAELKYHTQLISAGRFVNDSMGGYIGKKVVKQILSYGKPILNARILVMGMTFKENVADIRNSKVIDIINEFKDYGVTVDVVDPYADPKQVEKFYHIKLSEQPQGQYDAIVVAVAHEVYGKLTEDYFLPYSSADGILVDVKGLYRNKIHKLHYWSL
ncbi:MAG: nucleotide sugar dehydrogenase [Bacteroidales bacterium]|nr:nucleotide sugar dehydrogenase [Bacteroidales bacterium]